MMRYDRLMKRTTIMLPEDVDMRLRMEARRRGVPIAAVVRAAVEHHLPEPPSGRRPAFFAIGKDGSADTSERVDEIVLDVFQRRDRARGGED
jgi:Ribbon-helix-helix protein, copG family